MIMTSFFAWNTRGFNDSAKHKVVHDWLRNSSPTPSFGCLLETRVQEGNYEAIVRDTFPGWKSMTNYDHHRLGRIWFLWSPCVEVITLFKGPQLMSFLITIPLGISFVCSCIYASNFQVDRRSLWDALRQNKSLFVPTETPWIILGDFNDTLTSSEHSNPTRGFRPGMHDFQVALEDCELVDLRYEGPVFTWWNHRSADPIGKKLDRALTNGAWLSTFPSAYASFEANGISDHARCVVRLTEATHTRKVPFRFFNFLIDDPQFLDVIRSNWENTPPIGHNRSALQVLSRKLKLLKPALRHLNKHRYSDLPRRSKDAFDALCHAQNQALHNPTSDTFAAVDHATTAWQLYARAEENFFRQRSHINWLAGGDHNTAFFHNSVRDRRARNSVTHLISSTGTSLNDPKLIHENTVRHFRDFLNPNDPARETLPPLADLIRYRCPDSIRNYLISPVSAVEIKQVVDSLPNNKATSPDGYTAEFFRAA